MPYVEVNGVRLYVQITGTGTPIVFIHPPLLTSVNFIYQQQKLSEQFQVITFDLRGHGKSDAGNETFTYPLIVQDIVALLNYLQIEKAYLAGYSTGGSIALEALLHYPDRFCGGILISTMAKANGYYLKSLIQLASLLTTKVTLPLLASSIAKSNADCSDTYRILYKEALLGNTKRIQEYYQNSLIYNCVNRLREISHPTLLLFGNQDTRFQKNAKVLQSRLQNHLFHVVKGVKHQLPTKAAQFVNKCIGQFILYKA